MGRVGGEYHPGIEEKPGREKVKWWYLVWLTVGLTGVDYKKRGSILVCGVGLVVWFGPGVKDGLLFGLDLSWFVCLF